MRKKSARKTKAWKELLEIIKTDEWKTDKDLEKKVQTLAKIANGEEKRVCGRIICVFHEGKLVAEGSSYKLMKLLDLSDATIRRRARNNSVDDDGRQFKYAEEKKC